MARVGAFVEPGMPYAAPRSSEVGAARSRVGAVLLLGLAIRLLLVPLHHPWDLQTFAGVWADLIHGRNPYTRMDELSLLTSSDRGTIFARNYEYFAYPPGILYVDYPLARLYGLAHPDFEPRLTVQNTVPVEPQPLGFMLLLKAPVLASDVGIFLLLLAMAGPAMARRFFLNPYVILVSGAWMFDSLPALTVVAAIWAGRRRRWGWAGALLGAGAVLKFLPAVLLPAFLLVAWRESGGRRAARAVAGFAAVAVPRTLPFLPGVMDVLRFHATRPGGGLTVFQAFRLVPAFRDGLLLEPQAAGSALGALLLAAAMGGAVAWLLVRPMSLERASILMLAAFLLGSKVVNEQYVFLLVPLLLLELSRLSTERRELAYGLAWSLPLGFAAMNVPFLMFLVPLGLHVAPGVFEGVARSPATLVTASPLAEIRMVLLTLVAVAFALTLVLAIRAYCAPERRAATVPVEAP
ncbi:MAG: hypothetical protein HY658_09370 [Actinobacteria bacterium]|nr:hypothetical protein [Actinomycetota bacterium]